METKLKILTALLIPYGFICAGLYQIAFWSPFGINGFAFLDISDIVLSFIHPFLLTSISSLVVHLIHFNLGQEVFPYGGGNATAPSKNKRIAWIIIESAYLFSIICFIILLEDKWKGLFLPLYILPGLYFMVSEFLLKQNIMSHSKNRFFLLYLVVFLPVLSFTSGTRNAYQIYENQEYMFSDEIIPGKTLKLIAKTSEHYIFITSDNTEKYFFAEDELKILKLREYKKN